MAMTQEELEQFILDYMDEHIEERIAQMTDDVIDQRIRQYMEENGAAVEDSGPTGEVPLVPDDYFTANEGQHMTDTSLPMVANMGSVQANFIQARIRAFALAAASLVDASNIATPLVPQVDNNITINPNVMNVWSTPLSSLVIRFAEGESGRVAHYMLQFVTADGFSLTLPRGIRWMNDEDPEWVTGSTYQISIEDNLAIFAAFPA